MRSLHTDAAVRKPPPLRSPLNPLRSSGNSGSGDRGSSGGGGGGGGSPRSPRAKRGASDATSLLAATEIKENKKGAPPLQRRGWWRWCGVGRVAGNVAGLARAASTGAVGAVCRGGACLRRRAAPSPVATASASTPTTTTTTNTTTTTVAPAVVPAPAAARVRSPSAAERVALAVLVLVLAVLNWGAPALSWWRERAHQLSRAGFDPVVVTATVGRTKRLPRYEVGRLPAVLDHPFIVTGLCWTDYDESMDPCSKPFGGWGVPTLSGPRFADAVVAHFPTNMDPKSRIRPARRRMADAVAALLAPAGLGTAQPLPQVLQWSMPLEDWEGVLARMPPLPAPFARVDAWLRVLPRDLAEEFVRLSHWRMLLVGNAGGGMFNHKDTLSAASWQLQLHGSKWWSLCPPGARVEADVHATMHGAAHEGMDMLFASRVLPAQRARAWAAECFLDVVTAGELVFYPGGYWHQTLNAPLSSEEGRPDVAVALSETVVDERNWRWVAGDLLMWCKKPHVPDVTPSPRLCEAFVDLLLAWDKLFDGSGSGRGDSGGGSGGDISAKAGSGGGQLDDGEEEDEEAPDDEDVAEVLEEETEEDEDEGEVGDADAADDHDEGDGEEEVEEGGEGGGEDSVQSAADAVAPRRHTHADHHRAPAGASRRRPRVPLPRHQQLHQQQHGRARRPRDNARDFEDAQGVSGGGGGGGGGGGEDIGDEEDVSDATIVDGSAGVAGADAAKYEEEGGGRHHHAGSGGGGRLSLPPDVALDAALLESADAAFIAREVLEELPAMVERVRQGRHGQAGAEGGSEEMQPEGAEPGERGRGGAGLGDGGGSGAAGAAVDEHELESRAGVAAAPPPPPPLRRSDADATAGTHASASMPRLEHRTTEFQQHRHVSLDEYHDDSGSGDGGGQGSFSGVGADADAVAAASRNSFDEAPQQQQGVSLVREFEAGAEPG